MLKVLSLQFETRNEKTLDTSKLDVHFQLDEALLATIGKEVRYAKATISGVLDTLALANPGVRLQYRDHRSARSWQSYCPGGEAGFRDFESSERQRPFDEKEMSKLYGDFTAADWSRGLSVPLDFVPRTLIMHGEVEHESNLVLWRELLGPRTVQPQWYTVLGEHRGTKVAFANVVGGPMAAMTAHPCCVMGTEIVIQTGYFGGLSEEVDYGDILIVSAVKLSCGAAACYSLGEERIEADQVLVQEAVAYCASKGWSYVVGEMRSTDALCLETVEVVRKWSQEGHLGVDMETSATFAVARKLGRRPVGLLNLSDHMLRGDHLMNYDDSRHMLEAEIDGRIRELALHLAVFEKELVEP